MFIAFPQQQWLHERASVLRHTYTASFFCGLGFDLHDIVCRCVSISLDYTALNSGMIGEWYAGMDLEANGIGLT